MALAITWGGYADTNLNFSEFFSGAHTVAVRFMLQYPHTVKGPMLSDGTGTYVVGKGDFAANAAGQVALLLQVGTVQVSPLVTLASASWHFLAVVRTGNSLQLFLDGRPVGASLTIPAGGLPSGTLRLGKTTFGARDGGGAQFYGLLDDVAVFTRALSAFEISQLASAQHLSGNEAGLQAGYVFGHVPPGGLPATLSRPVTTVPGASFVEVSANRDNSEDGPRLPLALTSLMHVPFAGDESWLVIQGFDNPNGSHAGGASFCLDLMLAGRNQSESSNVPFHAVAPGSVDTVKQDSVSGTMNISNFITVKQAPLEMCDYLHLATNSARVSVGNQISFGQQLATVGDTGTNVGAFHLHIAVTNLGEGHKTEGEFVTIPAPYSNYDISDDGGNSWRHVLRGVPQAGQWIRRGSEWRDNDLTISTGAPPAAGAPMGYVFDIQHVVFRATDGHIHELWWSADPLAWHDNDLTASTGAPPAAGDPMGYVFADIQHVVFRATDGHIHELWWSADPLAWHDNDLTISTGAPLTAGVPMGYVFADIQHVVFRATDGHIHELWWSADPLAWHDNDLTASTGAPLAAGDPMGYVFADIQHVVFRATDGHIHELWWSADPLAWHDNDLTASTGAPLAAGDPMGSVFADIQHVVFRATDGHIHELWWSADPLAWHDNDLTISTGAPLAAGDPMGYVFADIQHVVFRATDGHIHELWWSADPLAWHDNDLTTSTGAPLAAGDPMGYVFADIQHVVFRATDGHIHELWWWGRRS